MTDFFFSKVIEGVETYLNSFRLHDFVMRIQSMIPSKRCNMLAELIHIGRVDGIIFTTPNVLPENHILKRPTKEHPIPVILVDRGMLIHEIVDD